MNITKLPNAYFIYLPPDEETRMPGSWININLIKEIEEHPNMIGIKFEGTKRGYTKTYTGTRMKVFKEEFTKFIDQQSNF